MLGLDLIPLGELAGVPSLTLPVGGLDLGDPTALVEAVLRRRTVGVSHVTLVGAAWGSPELDAAIHYLQADPRTAEHTIWAHRPASESDWSAGAVWWCLDVSHLLSRPVSVPALITRIQQLPFLPVAQELVVVAPDGGISAAHLDELSTRLDCPTGWVYAHPDTWSACEVAVTQACGQWGLRPMSWLGAPGGD